MKIAVMSDIHFGDPACRLQFAAASPPAYNRLVEVIRRFTGGDPLDYLVLGGDTLDFSMAHYNRAFAAARPFFRRIIEDELAQELVYIPGNHDKHVWDAVEWEVNVIDRLRQHRDPRPFRRTQPGVIDVARGERLVLDSVNRDQRSGLYGGLFIEGLFDDGTVIPVSVVYPNLYLKTSEGVLMVTHGHLLEAPSVLLPELLSGEPELAGRLGLKELEQYNAPVNAAICTGIGQAGGVSELFYTIVSEGKRGKTTRLEQMLDRVLPRLDKRVQLPWLFEFVDNAWLWGLRKVAIRVVEETIHARYDQKYFDRREVRRRFGRFYAATCVQTDALGLEPPARIIAGHTHEPRSTAEPIVLPGLAELGGAQALLYNTGGWLDDGGRSAEIFLLDENGLSSVNIA